MTGSPIDPSAAGPLLTAMLVAAALLAIADIAVAIVAITYRLRLQDAIAAGDHPLPRAPFASAWSVLDPFLGFQAAVLIVTVISSAGGLFIALLSGKPSLDLRSPAIAWFVTVTLLLQNVLFAGVVAFYVHRYGSSLRAIGFRRPTLRLVGLGVGIGVALILLSTVVENALGAGLGHATTSHLKKLSESADAGAMFAGIRQPFVRVLFALTGAVAAPIGEELFFRGFLYNTLKRRWSIPTAMVVSGFCFALAHLSPFGFLIIFPMGILLAWVYERTNSLAVTIVVHAINNGTAFIGLALAAHH